MFPLRDLQIPPSSPIPPTTKAHLLRHGRNGPGVRRAAALLGLGHVGQALQVHVPGERRNVSVGSLGVGFLSERRE